MGGARLENSFDMDALTARLAAMSDSGYGAFSGALVPGAQNMLGVRLPALRGLAAELRHGDWRAFLEASRSHPVFEVRMLHGMVLGGAKCSIGEKLRLADAFLPFVENWSVCDSFCASFKPKATEKDALFAFVRACADAPEEFRKRFGLVMMMNQFRNAPWVDGVMDAYRRFSHEGYYARMAAAWGLATLFLARREECLEILRDGRWDDFTHNKAIQKLIESRRVSDEDKAMLRTMKRKKAAE